MKAEKDTQVEEIYAKRAKWYDLLIRLLGYSAARKAILRTLPLEIPSSARILDLGCGTGLATEVLLERFPNAHIIGLDISEEMLRLYKAKFPKVQAVIGDFNKKNEFRTFPQRKRIKLASFDLVMSTGAVSEYGDLGKALPLIHKLLKKGGTFVNIGVERNLLGKLISRAWNFQPTASKEFQAACEKAGFGEVRKLSFPWYLFVSNLMNYIIKTKK